MKEAIMLALVWAAACYRIIFSLQHPLTLWRTAFTTCAVSLALGTTLSTYGLRLDAQVGVWSLSKLLSHLVLTVGAGSALIYVITLQKAQVSTRAVAGRLALTAAVCATLAVAWTVAPIHDRPYPDLVPLSHHPSVAVFKGVFYAFMMAAMLQTAQLCLSRAVRRGDSARTVSMVLTGSACVGGALIFALWGGAVLIRCVTGRAVPSLSRAGDAMLPFVLIAFALGTLALLVAPWLIAYARSWYHWRSMRPLWRELVRLRPEVHLPAPALGGPLTRARLREQRAIVEIHDALRLIRVPVGPGAGPRELGRVLREHRDGDHVAADVLNRTKTHDDDLEQVLALARTYSEARP